ncbi:MAG TPA: hypothetical protein VFT91_00970 [Dehalococcoidia bacterium]|nr:hypothetical protein [Dehalococcoidia bacterium]
MYAYPADELLRALAREREEEARRVQAGAFARQARQESREPLRSRLARLLVEVARHVDPPIRKAGRPSAGPA